VFVFMVFVVIFLCGFIHLDLSAPVVCVFRVLQHVTNPLLSRSQPHHPPQPASSSSSQLSEPRRPHVRATRFCMLSFRCTRLELN
jgi:hypothetical protein